MGDLGDIFDMFSQDNESDKKKRQGQDAESQGDSNTADPKSLIINKILQNKALLITLIVTGILIIGAIGYFLFGYLNDHGAQGIIDNVKPFIK